ncbi:DUF3833 domain-containing protein [Roseomonas sp. OT10]|uniref:DUF3833 family protein n=1 Tax=Roseomonas cutis TaxID=2897332 RepID=UPI001E496543|nr:DUF3833 family protein [Roseomonas sp. OT10]UFN49706.1 DUF3833 domain-containing protein [Roseomonas sp. OT10]
MPLCRRACLAALLPLAACGTTAGTFASQGPPFRPEQFFAGRLRSQGLFANRLGAIDRWFTAELEGRWDGQTLTFDETFHYEDGFTDRRHWELRRIAPARWRGTATDAVGEVAAEESGNAFHLLHTLDMPRADGSRRRLSFDQWFVRVSEEEALSRAAVSWHGLVQVGTAQVAFRRLG